MLVLSRQRDETIMVGDDIEVTVVDIRGDKVRLGITAPKEVAVHRKEVYEAIKRENRAAAQVNAITTSTTPLKPKQPLAAKPVPSGRPGRVAVEVEVSKGQKLTKGDLKDAVTAAV